MDESFSHEHIFADKDQIRGDDGDGSEKGFKTFGKLGPSEITGVHGNVHSAGHVEENFVSLDHNFGAFHLHSISHSLELH